MSCWLKLVVVGVGQWVAVVLSLTTELLCTRPKTLSVMSFGASVLLNRLMRVVEMLFKVLIFR
jgi:hypothetical protein